MRKNKGAKTSVLRVGYQFVAKVKRFSLATELAIPLQRSRSIRQREQRQPRLTTSLYARGSRKYLNQAERRRFIASAASNQEETRLFCLVLYWSGARVSECLALTATSFNIEDGLVALETLKRRKRGIVREVPLPPELISALETHFRIKQRQLDDYRRSRPLWSWSRTTAWRVLKRVMTDACIVGASASPKGLRHTFGVSAFQAGVPPHLVQRWLGHASFRTTTIYADVSGPEERSFAARMWRYAE